MSPQTELHEMMRGGQYHLVDSERTPPVYPGASRSEHNASRYFTQAERGVLQQAAEILGVSIHDLTFPRTQGAPTVLLPSTPSSNYTLSSHYPRSNSDHAATDSPTPGWDVPRTRQDMVAMWNAAASVSVQQAHHAVSQTVNSSVPDHLPSSDAPVYSASPRITSQLANVPYQHPQNGITQWSPQSQQPRMLPGDNPQALRYSSNLKVESETQTNPGVVNRTLPCNYNASGVVAPANTHQNVAIVAERAPISSSSAQPTRASLLTKQRRQATHSSSDRDNTQIHPAGVRKRAAPRPSYDSPKQQGPRVSRRRGPFKNEQQKLETEFTRYTTACIRCRQQRIRCKLNLEDPYGDCLTCKSVTGPMLIKLPCLRYKITEAQLLDKAEHPRVTWTKRWTSMRMIELDSWKSAEIRTITLTQDVGGACYSLKVREFVPAEGDAMYRTWKTQDVVQQYLCAPYAIADMQDTAKQLCRFVDKNISTFIEYYIDESDRLLRHTYSMAYRYAQIVEHEKDRVLLQAVLRLWVASRMESRQERICSTDTLGMTPQLWDITAANYGHICVPPVMQAQIEIITTSMVLLPMKQKVLKGLEQLVRLNEPQHWFTIYLVMFILLHSCALLTKAENVRANRELPVGSNIRYHNPALVKDFHNGANVMLAHFHYCNKGSHPFAMDWSQPRNLGFAKLDGEQVDFIKDTVEDVQKRRGVFKRIRENSEFEHDYYFLAQLYDIEWAPMRVE